MTSGRVLQMQYSGGLVRHLGLQLYSGAVGAVSELITNAWDADASTVYITIPFDTDWTGNSTIIVQDKGHGMNFEECNIKYLMVGRDRRKNGDYTARHRKVIGRKGIGKLACFGVARLMEIRTVKDAWVTHFSLDYDAILENSGEAFVANTPYLPLIVEDGSTKEDSGTTVFLKRIQLRRRIKEEEFRRSLARQFAILSDDFRVFVNNTLLERTEAPFELRFPSQPGSMQEDDVPGIGTIKWWVGFTPKPIPDEQARGVVIMVRDRLAQTPFFFNLSGGTTGQLGMQYMTGEVYAELDNDTTDVIATDRASIRWEDPKAAPLVDWGIPKVKWLLGEWLDYRQNQKMQALEQRNIPYLDRINRFPVRERKEIMRAVQQFSQIETIDEERFVQLVDLLLKAFENEQFMEMIRAINMLDEMEQHQLFALMTEANVLEAIQMATLIRMKIEIIRKFRDMINAGAKEKPDMQDILRDNPWLMDPAWATLEHEKSLDTIVKQYFDGRKSDRGNTRLDLFCLGDSLRKVVVEVKRPGLVVGREEIQQAIDYVFHLRDWAGQSSDPAHRVIVQGYLIASTIRPSDVRWKGIAEKEGVYVRTWDDLLTTAERLYGEFFDLITSKAPANDPRILALGTL